MSDHVCILMATFNGARFLQEQLASFTAQTHSNWSLHISDDRSTDATLAIIERFKAANPDRKIVVSEGPKNGSAANFISIVKKGGWPEGAWIAFSDQDDVWMPEKLERALSQLSRIDQETPCVYASRTLLTDATLSPLCSSKVFKRDPAFENALVQNVLAGNTITLNPMAAKILYETADAARNVIHHDWWVYLLMSGVGANILNDNQPTVYYRQHDVNHLGANRGLAQYMSRLNMILDGTYSNWVDQNLEALAQVSYLLRKENQESLDRFSNWRGKSSQSLLKIGLFRTGVWRQSGIGNIALFLSALFGRL